MDGRDSYLEDTTDVTTTRGGDTFVSVYLEPSRTNPGKSSQRTEININTVSNSVSRAPPS